MAKIGLFSTSQVADTLFVLVTKSKNYPSIYNILLITKKDFS